MVETNIDDMNPEFYEYIMERLFEAGALDVFYTPIQMKKNRPATKVNVLVQNEYLDTVINILMEESSSLGIRVIEDIKRLCLRRKYQDVETPWGTVTVKLGIKNGRVINVSPEYEDCKQAAKENNIPLKKVYNFVEKSIELS